MKLNNDRKLLRKAVTGALWQVLGGSWQTVLRLGTSMVLARYLEPADFGIFGMALLVNDFVDRMGPLNMGSGLIVKKDVTQSDYATCFAMMCAVRLSLFAIINLIAPFASEYFSDIRLISILHATSLIFIFTLISSVSRMILFKSLKFKLISIIESLGMLFESLIAICLVLTTDLTYWALVIAMLSSSFIINIALLLLGEWRPSLSFDIDSFRFLFRYGINSLGKNVVEYIIQNIDYFIVGKLFGANYLGLYEFAYRIPHLVESRFVWPASGVIFPSLAKIQEHKDRVIHAFIKTTQYIAVFTFPLLGGLAIVADSVVLLIWGIKWLPVVTPLRILCLSSAIRCIMVPVNSVYLVNNRPDISFRTSLINLFFSVPIVTGMGYVYGINGVALGMLISLIPYVFINYYWAVKITSNFLLSLIRSLLAPSLATILCMISAKLGHNIVGLLGYSIFLQIFVAVLLGGVIYIGFLFVFAKNLFLEIVDMISILAEK